MLLLLLGMGFSAQSHQAPTDELECHYFERNGTYHCHSGPLAGKVFSSKEQAQNYLVQPTPTAPTAPSAPESSNESEVTAMGATELAPTPTAEGSAPSGAQSTLKAITWKLKRSARGGVEVDRIANVISTSDLVAFRDVVFGERGDTPVTVIATLLEKRLSERVCRGWFRAANGERGQHALIWRESRLAWIRGNGEVVETCGSRPLTISSDIDDGSTVLFLHKSTRRIFAFASVNVGTPSLIKPYARASWPTLYMGGFNKAASDRSFEIARKAGFAPAIKTAASPARKGKRLSQPTLDNMWFKGMSYVMGGTINLYQIFPEMKLADLDAQLGNEFPVTAEFAFSESDAQAMQATLVPRSKRIQLKPSAKGMKSKSAPSNAESYPAPAKKSDYSDLSEDLEKEASGH